MLNLRATLECTDGVTPSLNVLHLCALLAALFMVVGTVHESRHDHSDHDVENECVICTIVSVQTAKPPLAPSFMVLVFASYKMTPIGATAIFISFVFFRPRTRGPPIVPHLF